VILLNTKLPTTINIGHWADSAISNIIHLISAAETFVSAHNKCKLVVKTKVSAIGNLISQYFKNCPTPHIRTVVANFKRHPANIEII
jgi:hypothetical protein